MIKFHESAIAKRRPKRREHQLNEIKLNWESSDDIVFSHNNIVCLTNNLMSPC